MSKTTIREDILSSALECVKRDRNLDYDEPEKNFERIADLWNVYLGDKLNEDITPHDTAIMAILIKVARVMSSPSKKDHWIDIAGYAACGAECVVENDTEEKQEEARELGWPELLGRYSYYRDPVCHCPNWGEVLRVRW